MHLNSSSSILYFLIFILLISNSALFAEAAEGTITPSKKSLRKRTRLSPEVSNTDSPALNSEDQKALKENWLLPMDKSKYLRLSRRFVGLNDFNREENIWVLPGTAIFAAPAYGAQWGDIFAGLNFVRHGDFGSDNVDAFMGVGFGLGNAQKYVGADFQIGILDLHLFFKSGMTLSTKIHHLFSDGTAIAIGRTNWLQWGDRPPQSGKSWYGSVSRVFYLDYDPSKPFSLLVVHLGLGDGQFGNQLIGTNNISNKIGFFAATAIRVLQPLNFILEWSHDLNMGLSITPFRRTPISITVSATSLLNRNHPQAFNYSLSIAYGDSVFSDTFPINFGQKKK